MELTAENLHNKLNSVIGKVFEDGTVSELNDPSRVKRLRISSFPFCAVQWFLNLPSNTSKSKAIGAGMKYYVTVGHAVHDTVQALLAALDMTTSKVHVIADWECKGCHKRFDLQRKPSSCSSCSCRLFKFHEATVQDENVLGHIDTILEITLEKKSKEYPHGLAWIVIDYKTSSLGKVGTEKMVSHDNRAQIRAYVNILKKMRKPVMPFAALVYIPRDDPFQFKIAVQKVDFKKEEKALVFYKKQHYAAIRAKTLDDLRNMVEERPCSEKILKQFEWCKWRHLCAGEDNSKAVLREMNSLRKVIDKRLPIKDWNP